MAIPADAVGGPDRPGLGLGDRLDDITRRLGGAARRQSVCRNWLWSVGAVWLASGVALIVLPPRYASTWTLILPAAQSGSTVALDTIGQSTTQPGQPFGSVSLSPKVIYKEILRSEQVLKGASAALGLKPTDVERPRVKLIDETSLLVNTAIGRTPEEAQRRALAFIATFNTQLDMLRKDEIDKRAASVRESLAAYQAKLDAARRRILAAQQETGVVSINQFNEAATSIELIRRRLADQTSDLEKLIAEQQLMISRLGLEADLAAGSLKLMADPAFAKLASDFADAHAAFTQASARYGTSHPILMDYSQRRSSSLAQLAAVAGRAGIGDSKLSKLALIANNSHHAELLKQLVGHEAQIEGRRREIASLEAELASRRGEMQVMSASSARLEDLKKDHLVAEAVFTSAVARLDTNRTDVFASYPMVQVLAEPDLPDPKLHPLMLYAGLAALFGTLMLTLAWGLVWLRPLLLGSRTTSA
jgi:uncharacterized protein involved in exopolysaccharide biosynthesis